MAELPSRHAHKIAVARGLTPERPSRRPKAVPVIKPDASPSADAMKLVQDHVSSLDPSSSNASVEDDLFSVGSGQSTNTSEAPTAFADGWKEAMRQVQAEQPHAYTDVDRFAIHIVHVLDLQMASGSRLTPGGSTRNPADSEVELFFPALFRSICICDMSIMGNPIQLKSRHFSLSPRGLTVGKAEFLNLPRQQKHACHLSFRPGVNKTPQYILEYSNALVSVDGNKPGYVIATQMDVTNTVNNLAEVLNAKFWMNRGIKEPRRQREGADQDIDWVEAGQKRTESYPVSYEGDQTAKDELITTDPSVLEFREMIEDIKFFHSEYLTLSVGSDGTGQFWQINYVSPILAAHLDDVKVSFNHTPPDGMIKLGTVLAGDHEATLSIRWGVNGEPRRIYCCPMFRHVKSCWLCFLTSDSVGDLWDLRFSRTPSP